MVQHNKAMLTWCSIAAVAVLLLNSVTEVNSRE